METFSLWFSLWYIYIYIYIHICNFTNLGKHTYGWLLILTSLYWLVCIYTPLFLNFLSSYSHIHYYFRNVLYNHISFSVFNGLFWNTIVVYWIMHQYVCSFVIIMLLDIITLWVCLFGGYFMFTFFVVLFFWFFLCDYNN